MSVLIGIQARSDSTRLPKKIYEMIGKHSLLEWVYRAASAAADRIRESEKVQVIILGPDNDVKLRAYCEDRRWAFFPGHPTDLLDRYVQCVERTKADVLIRLTSDCWRSHPGVIYTVASPVIAGVCDYASNTIWRSWIEGKDVQACTRKALYWFEYTQKTEREHPFKHFDQNEIIRQKFLKDGYTYKKVIRPGCPIAERTSIDTLEDLVRARLRHDEAMYDLMESSVPQSPVKKKRKNIRLVK